MDFEFDVKDIKAMKEEGTLGDFIRMNAGLTQKGRAAQEEFTCPHCKAGPKQRCTTKTGHTLPEMHPARTELLKPLPPEPIHPVGHWPTARKPGGDA